MFIRVVLALALSAPPVVTPDQADPGPCQVPVPAGTVCGFLEVPERRDSPGRTIQVAYGIPTRYEITIFRVTVSELGDRLGWTVESLCDEALGYGGLTLSTCPRASLAAPPRPFRFRDAV